MRRVFLVSLLMIAVLTSALGVAQAEKAKLLWTTCCAQPERWDLFQDIARQYMEQNPNVEIEWVYPSGNYTNNLKTWFASGMAPDVLWIGADIWAFVDLLMPLNEIVDKDPGVAAINPGLMPLVNFQGKQIGIPYAANARVMFYNKDHFSKAGVAAPASNWTFDDLSSIAKRLTVDADGDGTNEQWGFTYWSNFNALHWGGNFYTPDQRKTRIADEGNVAPVQFFADMWSGKLNYATKTWSLGQSGQASMADIGVFNVPAYAKADFSWDVANMPTFVGNGKEYRNSYVTLENWAINRNTKHAAEAKDFVRFLFSKEVMEQISASGIAIPTQRATAVQFTKRPAPPQNLMAFINALDYGPQLALDHPYGRDITNWMTAQDVFKQLWAGEVPARVALPELEKGVNNLLDEYWAALDAKK